MNFKIPNFDLNLPLVPQVPIIQSPAEYAFESLVEQVQTFEKDTSDEEVVAAMLASFGQSVTIHIHRIRRNGQMFCLEGVTDSGSPATLIQHFTQASILLLKVPKAPAEEKRPIGFLE